MRKLVLYIAASLDGFISKPNDDLSFLSIVQKEGEDYGYSEFISTIDTVLVGRRTYDWVMSQVSEFPHSDKETFIITRKSKPSAENIHFYSGDLKELVTSLKAKSGKNIFCDGGAELINGLLKDDLIDEMIISVIPVLVGSGIRLFKEGINERKIELLSSKKFDTGLVQLHYKFLK